MYSGMEMCRHISSIKTICIYILKMLEYSLKILFIDSPSSSVLYESFVVPLCHVVSSPLNNSQLFSRLSMNSNCRRFDR